MSLHCSPYGCQNQIEPLMLASRSSSGSAPCYSNSIIRVHGHCVPPWSIVSCCHPSTKGSHSPDWVSHNTKCSQSKSLEDLSHVTVPPLLTPLTHLVALLDLISCNLSYWTDLALYLLQSLLLYWSFSVVPQTYVALDKSKINKGKCIEWRHFSSLRYVLELAYISTGKWKRKCTYYSLGLIYNHIDRQLAHF